MLWICLIVRHKKCDRPQFGTVVLHSSKDKCLGNALLALNQVLATIAFYGPTGSFRKCKYTKLNIFIAICCKLPV